MPFKASSIELSSIVDVITIDRNTYWIDINLNGKIEERETFDVGDTETREKAADRFIDKHFHTFWKCIDWKPNFTNKSRLEYFDSPEKREFGKSLDRDIKRLEGIEEPHPIYIQLLDDLREIRENLDTVHFKRFGLSSLIPVPWNLEVLVDHMIAPAYLLEATNTIHYLPGVSDSILVHEMTHKLMLIKTGNWTLMKDIDVKLYDGTECKVPPDPDMPDYRTADISIEVYLDQRSRHRQPIIYNDYAFRLPYITQYITGTIGCYTVEYRNSLIALEVEAFEAQARYILFKLGLSYQELHSLEEMNENCLETMEKIKDRLEDQPENPHYPAEFQFELIKHYFGFGGISTTGDLIDLVKFSYSDLPGFKKPETCETNYIY